MKLFILLLCINLNAFAIDLNSFTSDLKISYPKIGNEEISSFYKFIDQPTPHYLFKILLKNKSIYDVDLQTNVLSKDAEKLIKNQSSLLNMIYNDAPTPYAGVVTNTSKCDPIFKPKILSLISNSQKIDFWQSSAGNNYQYGACTRDQVKFWVCTLFYYQKELKIFHKVKYYTDIKSSSCSEGIAQYLQGLTAK
jgi:hypothetical protein